MADSSRPTAHARSTPRRTRIATRKSSSCCSPAWITTSQPTTSRRSTSGRGRCSSIAAIARARAYIERARSALAERQRESEELLHDGVAALDRGEGAEARRLLQAAIDGGARAEDASALFDRLKHEPAGGCGHAGPRGGSGPAAVARPARVGGRPQRIPRRRRPSLLAMTVLAAGIGVYALAGRFGVDLAIGACSARRPGSDRRAGAGARSRVASAAARRDGARPRAVRWPPAAVCVKRWPCSMTVRPADLQKPEADRLRGDIQRQLLELAAIPRLTAPAPDGGQGDRAQP